MERKLDPSHIGRLHEQRPPLQRADFERFTRLAENTAKTEPKELRGAVRELSLRLNHQLVAERELVLPDEGPGRLATFTRSGDSHTYYVVVTGSGRLGVGCADLLQAPKLQTLEDFDARRFEVVSLAVSRLHRFVGERLDLWVLVRSVAKAEDRDDDDSKKDVLAYHGLISFEGPAKVEVQPVADDWQDGQRRWRAAPVHGLPKPLLKLRFTYAPDADPCSPIEHGPLDELRQAANVTAAGLEQVARSRDYLATYTERGIPLVPAQAAQLPEAGHLLPRVLEEPFSFLCLQDDLEVPQRVHGVAGSDAQRLLGFSWQPAEGPGQAPAYSHWTQTLPRYPTDVAFVPRPGARWPDLLVLFRNGELHRLSYLGRDHLYQLWTRLWRQLCSDDSVDCRLQLAARAIRESSEDEESKARSDEQKLDNWRSTALFAATERILRQVRDDQSASDEQRLKWAKKLVDLFDPSMRTLHLRQSLNLVLRSFTTRLQRDLPATLAGDCCDFSVRVLYGVYNKVQFSHVELLSQIDRVVRSIPNVVLQSWQCSHLDFLIERSNRNRASTWQQREGGTQTNSTADDELLRKVFFANFGLERWANAFLPADSVRLWLPGEKEMEAPAIADLCAWQPTGDTPRLAVARGERLWFSELDEYARLHGARLGLQAKERSVATPNGAHLLRLLPLEGAGSGSFSQSPGPLVTADSNGQLYLVEWSRADKPELALAHDALPSGSTVWALARLPGAELPALLVGSQQDRRAELHVLRLEGGRLRRLATKPVGLQTACSLQAARRAGGGWHVLTASLQSGHVRLLTLRIEGDEVHLELDRAAELSQEGILTACFDDEQQPSCFVVGDRGGMLWCIDLQQQPSSETSWLRGTYKLDSAIRSVRAVRAFGEACFLAGSERGSLLLLRGRDGRRLWKHSQRSPVRQVRPLTLTNGETGLAVGMRDSWISVFVQTTEDDGETWAWTQAQLQEIAQVPLPTRERVFTKIGAEAVRVLAELLQKPTSLPELLAGHKLNRAARALALRYLVREWLPGSEIIRILERSASSLTLRELGLLLQYPREPEVVELVSLVQQELQRRVRQTHIPAGQRGDNGRNALMAAVVSALQHSPSARWNLNALLGWQPVLALIEDSPWVRVELAKRLLERLRLEHPEARGSELLALALPWLLRMPPSLVSGCAWVSQPAGHLRPAFEHLESWLRELQEATPVHAEPWRELAELLDGAEPATWKPRQLLQPLFELGAEYLTATGGRREGALQDENGEAVDWTQIRLLLLDPLRRLGRACRTVAQAELPGPLLPHLLALLPEKALPAEEQSQAERIEWWRQLEERLQTPAGKTSQMKRRRPGSEAPWHAVFEALAAWMHEVLQELQRREIAYLLNEARVRLELRTPRLEVDELQRVRLPLRLVPESRRQLQQVQVRLTALLGAPEQDRRAEIDFETFPTDPRSVELRGYVEPEQQSLQVQAELSSSEGARHSRTWSFALHRPPASEGADSSLDFLHQRLNERLRREPAPVRLVVLDRPLGRRAWGQAWRQSSGWRWVNLDDVLRETGEGRKYHQRPLGLQVIREAILTGEVSSRSAHPRAHDLGDETGPERQPILVGPMDQTLQRFLDGESPGQLSALMDWLEHRGPADKPPITLVVSARHAARLRQYGRLPALSMHLLLHRGEQHVQPQDRTLQQARTWLAESAGVPEPTAGEVLQRLGGDLALAAIWRRWWASKPRSTTTLSDDDFRAFLQQPEVEERLRAEFLGLSYWQRLYAVLGALASSSLQRRSVKDGLIAAMDYHSTGKDRQAGKLVQEAGEAFTARSLHALQVDARPPDQLQVEGLGTSGTARVPGGTTQLLPLALRADTARRQGTCQRLADLGLGTWEHGLFRTGEPYRTWVQRLYETHAGYPESARDGKVFEQLLGEGASPLEGLEPRDLEELGEELQHLYRDADSAQRLGLQRLAEAWTQTSGAAVSDKLGRGLRQLFSKDKSETLDPSRDKEGSAPWDAALRALSPVAYGLGSVRHHPSWSTSPRHYWLWLPAGAARRPEEVAQAAELCREQRRRRLRADQQEAKTSTSSEESNWHPSIALLGPGVDGWLPDTERRFAILRFADLLRLAWNGQLSDEGLIGFLRSQLRLTAMSPFSTSGSLEPGSPLFRGRESELEYLRQHVRQKSVLIVGARRVGKTSLLNQVYAWAKDQGDLLPIFVDLQYKRTPETFQQALERAVAQERLRLGSEALKGIASISLDSIAEAGRATGQLPLFLFNEIDGLVHNQELIGEWRSLSDGKRAQFVLVAYNAVAQLGKPESPFFNFTIGSDLEGKAIVLTALSQAAARSLVGLLTEEPVQLGWASEADRKQGEALLLERSYRIPWVLQRFAQLLVEHLEQKRRLDLRLADVEEVVTARGGAVWRYFQNLEWHQLGFAGSQDTERTRRPGYQLLLYAVVRQRYFLGAGPLIRDPRLAEQDPLRAGLGFSLLEAQKIFQDTIQQLLFEPEWRQVMRWLDTINLEQALRLLTLTLALEPDPKEPHRYGFLLHILPLELWNQYGEEDPTLDDLIIDTAVELVELMQLEAEPQSTSKDGEATI